MYSVGFFMCNYDYVIVIGYNNVVGMNQSVGIYNRYVYIGYCFFYCVLGKYGV